MPVTRALRAHYADLRGWAILAQMFLGIGWLRAGVAHTIEPSWWDGSELTSFVIANTGQSVDVYRPFVEEFVMSFPAAVSLVVLALELLTAVLLLSNIHPEIGLTIGGFLNVQFILAGAVNPSVFYLVFALGLLLWRLERVSTPRAARYHARRATALTLLALIIFGPSIRTFDPATAMEDPALVIVFLVGLVTITIWLTQPNVPAAEDQPTVLDPEKLDQAIPANTLPLIYSLQQLQPNSSERDDDHGRDDAANSDNQRREYQRDDDQPEDEQYIKVIDIA